jgi:hypothetical protein
MTPENAHCFLFVPKQARSECTINFKIEQDYFAMPLILYGAERKRETSNYYKELR